MVPLLVEGAVSVEVSEELEPEFVESLGLEPFCFFDSEDFGAFGCG